MNDRYTVTLMAFPLDGDWWYAGNVIGLLSEGICPEHRRPLDAGRCPADGSLWDLRTAEDGTPETPYRTITARCWSSEGTPFGGDDGFFASVSTPRMRAFRDTAPR